MGTLLNKHTYENGDILLLQGPDRVYHEGADKMVYTLAYGERVHSYELMTENPSEEASEFAYEMTNSEIFESLSDSFEAYELRLKSENPWQPIKTGKELK